MNMWLVATVALLPALLASVWTTFHGDTSSRLVGLEYSGLVAVLMLAMLAQGFNRPEFIDVALALGLLAFGGGMVFVRFLEGKL